MRKLFLIRRVVGSSMTPALKDGTVIVALPMEPMRGDVVIVMHRGIEKIKRIAKLNSKQVLVLGDNADASTDSRQFGALPMESVIGRVVWPRGLHHYR